MYAYDKIKEELKRYLDDSKSMHPVYDFINLKKLSNKTKPTAWTIYRWAKRIKKGEEI